MERIRTITGKYKIKITVNVNTDKNEKITCSSGIIGCKEAVGYPTYLTKGMTRVLKIDNKLEFDYWATKEFVEILYPQWEENGTLEGRSYFQSLIVRKKDCTILIDSTEIETIKVKDGTYYYHM